MNDQDASKRAAGYFHRLHKAEGKDALEAAGAAIEKAEFWHAPENYHQAMFEDAVRMATLRTNLALAVEIRKLRQALRGVSSL